MSMSTSSSSLIVERVRGEISVVTIMDAYDDDDNRYLR